MAVNRKSLENLKKGEATRFSHDNQPENPGRKPSVLGYIKGSGLSLDDYKRLLTNLIWEYDSKELAAILKNTNNKIPMGMTIVLGALIKDQERKSIDNYEKFMDRCFGKTTQGFDIKTSGNIEIAAMTREEKQKRVAELLKEAKAGAGKKKTEHEPDKIDGR
jgi:hypothetical protein